MSFPRSYAKASRLMFRASEWRPKRARARRSTDDVESSTRLQAARARTVERMVQILAKKAGVLGLSERIGLFEGVDLAEQTQE